MSEWIRIEDRLWGMIIQMANIIITTLDKLPERCCDCPCCKSENGTCQAIEDYRTSDWRPFWCPLEEQDA